MAKRPKVAVSPRKKPKQARANDLVVAVLEAAAQVLRAEGAAGFNTSRVAERAGVSIGSLYQYFPNKAAILFRMQADEWRQTLGTLEGILKEESRPPAERLRMLVHAFLRSECEEAQIRMALGDAAPEYREEPEADAARASGSTLIGELIRRILPRASKAATALAADLIETTLTAVGSSFSGSERTEKEIAAYANAMSEMFLAYLSRSSNA